MKSSCWIKHLKYSRYVNDDSTRQELIILKRKFIIIFFIVYNESRSRSVRCNIEWFENRFIFHWKTAHSNHIALKRFLFTKFLSLWWSRSWMLNITDNWRTQREMNVYCKQDVQISKCRWSCRARLVISSCQWAKRRSKFERVFQLTSNRSVRWRCQNKCDHKQCEYSVARCTEHDSERKTHVLLRRAIIKIIISNIWSTTLLFNRSLTIQYY